MIFNLLKAFFSDTTTADKEKNMNEENPLNVAPADSGNRESRYKADTEALMNIYGEDVACIDIELQDLLKIVPRNRKRIDAYDGLRSYLMKNYGLRLNITSQKTKNIKNEKL